MRPDAEDLARYYASPAGRRVLGQIVPRLSPWLRHDAQARLLALGFCAPLLDSQAEMLPLRISACPALQGIWRWPRHGLLRTVQVDERRLPFVDAFFDQLLMMHVLEYAEPARGLLREAWRVLAPAGELLLIVPNRASLHTLADASPFSNGRPFSFGQLERLLGDALFDIMAHDCCISLPAMLAGSGLDRILLRFLPRSGGVHMIRARKSDGAAPIFSGRTAPVQAPVHAGW
jgi:SAM-dependent methyltransferase